MATLDDFLPNVITQDTRKRIQAHGDLIPYLSDPHSSLTCGDIDELINGLVGWVNSSNYKVSVNGLEVLCLMVDRKGEDFKHYVSHVLPSVVDRLGDSKDQVRDMAQQLLMKLMMPATSPGYVFERMMSAFTHKLWHVREGVLICLQNTLNTYGARCLTLSKIVPNIRKLLDDQNSQVRETAINTLVEIYRHVGEKVRSDLLKKGISQQRLNQIFAKFDEVKMSGNMLATAHDYAPSRGSTTDDELDFGRPSSYRSSGQTKRSTSSSTIPRAPSRGPSDCDDNEFARPLSTKVPQAKKTSSSGLASGRKTPSASAVTLRRRRSISSTGASGAGGVDEDYFMKSFEDVPKIQLFSSRDLNDHITKIRDMLSDPNTAWEKRLDMMKTFRGVMIAGGAQHDDFLTQLRTLEPCMSLAIKDLRSQIVREACVTMAYLSQQLGNRLDHFCETQLPHLIALIPNSAKVMASSGIICIRFIIQYTHSYRLIPIITGNLTSKSNIIRRFCCELVNQVLHNWPTHVLEKHIANLQDAIKRGISDPDSDARAFARKAFWGFAEHFKDQADALLNALEPAKQKMLQGELSGSSSNNSLNSAEGLRIKSRPRSASQDRGFDSSTLGRIGKKKHSRVSSARSETGAADLDTPIRSSSRSSNTPKDRIMRSSSAVDLANGRMSPSPYGRTSPSPYGRTSPGPYSIAATSSGYSTYTPRRRTPAQVAALSRMTAGATSSLPRQKSSASSVLSPPERSRTRGRTTTSSQSQPNSRSGSPSSRLSYLTHTTGRAESTMTPGRPRRSAMVRSQGASREGSPTRMNLQPGRERRLSGSKLSTTKAGKGGNVMAQRLLRPGAELEDAMADALSPRGEHPKHIGPMRRRYDTYDSDDAASETSSVCSERSYSSLGRTSEASSTEFDKWYYRLPTPTQSTNKDQGTCSSSSTPPPNLLDIQDTAEIITLIGSGSYTDRKEGLIALQHLLRAHRYLNRVELRKVTEVFARMFHDPHSKVLSLFLDTLVDLMNVHSRDLTDQLYMIMTRLLMKTGADMLGSVQAKVVRALEGVRENFPCDQQFSILTKLLIDQTQSPNLKVKTSILHYMHGLVADMDPSDFMNSTDTRLALSRIINFTTEPKSADVRKGAQAVLIALFNLNPPEFSVMLSLLPKAFQDSATKILHNHIRTASHGHESDVLSPRNVTSPPKNRSRPPSRGGHRDEMETENMNPEDIYDSIKKTSADIQNLSFNSKLENYEDVRKKREFTSQDSGIQDLRNDSPDAADTRKGQYNPSHYQDEGTLNGYNKSRLADTEFEDSEMFNEDPWKALLGISSTSTDECSENDIISDILTELSNHNERNDQRKNAMLSLIKLTREGTFGLWDEHFKTILLILLETLGDNDGQVRALALRVLREILRNQPQRFRDYAELTTLRILEAHKDSVREVVRSAEECADTLANYIAPEQSVRILNPIIQTAQFPINLAAIKMQNKVIELLPKEAVETMMGEMIPGLLRGYDDQQSTVRKAAVFCLVSIYLTVGEVIWNHLTKLNYSKLKLLNLYIKRAQQKDSEKKVLSPNGTES
ncbi:CLIP-associating protein 1-like isoform X2 [Mizuhopecten yessoensis]|uniref:CLIP-associating protein 1-like isoform X2 n=1 Tax=Mizuhopecten yessoensis TaxID=6573 RepID=UPI000B45A5BF|nr:CLIP-associating protein 1-like isoform X2 [Mizuhopecten yessoensis]